MSKRKIFILLIVVVFLISATGCPARKPNAGPSPLNQRYQEEPTLSVYFVETGDVQDMRLEEYLKGVVAAEMDPQWPSEALAAQAIVARTFTMKKMEEGGVEERGTDASTDIEEFQAYDADRINENVKQAVADTRGQVASYEGNLINGWFHADGGGLTAASAAEGLAFTEEAPYIHSVEDPGFEITLPENKSWTASFPISQVREAVQEAVGSDPGEISTVEVVEEGPSGRATKVKLGEVTISGPGLRLALGSTEMRSTLWNEISISGGELVVSGQGYGHGVGLSQWGARAMAEQGETPEDIVKYFFNNVTIEDLWD
ncbi:MAG: stage II sporulation protein SpoIID [Desulfitibacter sp. BRH_c19]|nr:MAG: stage II sporulation protein SpoIID [Desulfitibacter sp. BRH_c19]